MTSDDYGAFKSLLFASADRHNRNVTTFDNVLQFQYAGTSGFRDATASRIVLEAGSGRTRAETNRPSETSAAAPAGP